MIQVLPQQCMVLFVGSILLPKGSQKLLMSGLFPVRQHFAGLVFFIVTDNPFAENEYWNHQEPRAHSRGCRP